VTILDSGRVEVEARQIGLHCCDELKIDLSDVESLLKLKDKITEGATPNLIRRVILKGLRNEDMRPSPEELEAELSDSFLHLRVTDQSHPRMAELSEDAYEGQLILARFLKLMKEHIEACEGEDRGIAEEALQYGLALLQGKDIL